MLNRAVRNEHIRRNMCTNERSVARKHNNDVTINWLVKPVYTGCPPPVREWGVRKNKPS